MRQPASTDYLVAFLLPFATFIAGVALFWQNCLDDTFIHLRYADHLLRTGRFEYNLGQPSFGCSAPLYVWGMTPVLRLLPRELWPLVPKMLSILCHAVTIGTCLALFCDVGRRAADQRPDFLRRWLWAAAFLTVALLCPPLVCRWLQDGMETSLATMLCVLGVWAISHNTSTTTVTRLVVMAVSAGLLGGLRVDLLPHAGAVLLAGLVLRPGKRMAVAVAASVMIIAIPHLVTLKNFGTLMPDTALAKVGGGFTPNWVFVAARSVVAMNPLWLLLAPAPLICIFLRWQASPRSIRPLVVLAIFMGPLMAVMAAGVMRNQIIQGARYFVPSLVLCGLAALVWGGLERRGGISRGAFIGSLVGVVLMLGMTMMRWPQINSLRLGIQADFPPMLDAGKSIFAADIGIIGWKTGSTIVDASRLVNGRAVAELSQEEWIRRCAAAGMADALILDQSDLQGVLQLVPGSRIEPVDLKLEIPSKNQTFVFECQGVVMRQQTVNELLEWRVWLRRKS